MTPRLVSGAKRFVKGFVAGGLASVVVMLNAGLSFSSADQAKHVAVLVFGAFVTGGLLALEKMYNFAPQQ